MQLNVSRLTSALRALTTGAGVQQLSATHAATRLSINGYICLGSCEGWSSACGPSHSPGSSVVREMSTSTPNKPEEPASQSSSSNSGPEPARPTFTARLRDLLAVSNWRISKGETGRLTNVKEDLVAAAAAASTEEGMPRLPPGHAAAEAAAEAAAAALQASTSSSSAAAAASDATACGPDGIAPLQQQLLKAQQGEQQDPHRDLPPQQRLIHPKYGYAALGGAVPSDDGATTTTGLVGMLTSQQPRVNPKRRFMPGETYEAQDLNPYTARTWSRARADAGAVRRPTAAEVMEKADYKNVAFLTRWFLSPGGRLLSRAHTRLPVTVHKYVSRQVKLARHMGLIAGEARLEKLHLARVREQELLEAQRRAAVAAAAAAAATAASSAAANVTTGAEGGALTAAVVPGRVDGIGSNAVPAVPASSALGVAVGRSAVAGYKELAELGA